MKIFRPLTTKGSPSRLAVVVMPATSEPASGSVIARAAMCSPRMAGTSHLRFCSSVPNLKTGWRPHLGRDVDSHAEPAQAGPRHLLGEDDGREVVTALPAVFGRVAQAQEAELSEAFEDGVWKCLLLPLLEVGLDLGDKELPNVQPELLVGVGEVHRDGV